MDVKTTRRLNTEGHGQANKLIHILFLNKLRNRYLI